MSPTIQERMEALEPTEVERVDTDEECQNIVGESRDDAGPCSDPAVFRLTIDSEYRDEPLTMLVCEGCMERRTSDVPELRPDNGGDGA